MTSSCSCTIPLNSPKHMGCQGCWLLSKFLPFRYFPRFTDSSNLGYLSNIPPKVLLLCRSWGACVPCRSQRLCQLEFWLLVGTTMLDRLWARGQTKCNTLLMLATYQCLVGFCWRPGDGGGRPSSVMSLGVTSVGGHSHGHPASPIGVGSSWEDIDPRSPEPLVVRGGWLWLIWVVRWTT